jgi:hypothetical protein
VRERFSATVQTGAGAHPVSFSMGTGSFQEVKRPERGVDHPSPFSANVKEIVELNIYSPSGPLCELYLLQPLTLGRQRTTFALLFALSRLWYRTTVRNLDIVARIRVLCDFPQYLTNRHICTTARRGTYLYLCFFIV